MLPDLSPTSPKQPIQQQETDVTAQAALSSPAARQTNNIVNTKAYYDVVFTTATSGAIKRIDMVFPAGTDLSQVRLLEREGIGAGGPGVIGNTLTYFVSNPVATVPANTLIRLEFANIGNPAAPDAGYKVSITIRDAAETS